MMANPVARPPVENLAASPLLTPRTLRHQQESSSHAVSTQYGLLGTVARGSDSSTNEQQRQDPDSRLFYNTMAPSSTFICGSQGSGKSHTLSCLLENCLVESAAAVLPKPLTALVFHYDTFISDDGGSPCEAAFLASLPGIKVRVLGSPSNISTIRKTYSRFNIDVQPLQLQSKDLNTKRMLDLMAVDQSDVAPPLYVHVIHRILREMRTAQQISGKRFDYGTFKERLLSADLSSAQLAPLSQRLSVLESFMAPVDPAPPAAAAGQKKSKNKKNGQFINAALGTKWTPKPGLLTIVDLSCPCVTSETACSLFNICLSLFLEQEIACGRVVALDEAHKYMCFSPESETLANTLLSAVRLQRHLGVRMIVSTQEPAIAPALLDLCSVTIVHRFSSPSWLKALRAHLAIGGGDQESQQRGDGQATSSGCPNRDVFEAIIRLNTGEALVFAPTAPIKEDRDQDSRPSLLGKHYLRVKIRARLSEDGGRSVMAT